MQFFRECTCIVIIDDNEIDVLAWMFVILLLLISIEVVFLVFRVASTIDAVLLSHPDTLHLGALPYAMKELGLSAPIFSTEPVYRLGLLTMYDQFLSRKVKLNSGFFGFFTFKRKIIFRFMVYRLLDLSCRHM